MTAKAMPQGPVDVNVRGWQPIETAPKDGTVIILAKGNDVFAGWWAPTADVDWHYIDDTAFSIKGCCDKEDGERIEPNGWIRRRGGPTAWMPLPRAS